MDIDIGEFNAATIPSYSDGFAAESEPLSLGITRIPESVIQRMVKTYTELYDTYHQLATLSNPNNMVSFLYKK